MLREKLKIFSLLSVALLISSGPAISANILAIEKEFPSINTSHVGLLTTIPSLFVIIGVLLGNRLERWMEKKKIILIGLGLVFLAGIFPALKHDFFSLLFLSRCIFGLGIGLFNRVIIQMISDLYQYDQKKKAQVIGMESSFEGLGGICLTLLVGQLLKINWHTSFLVYAIALPILIVFFFFVPNDKKKSSDKREGEQQTDRLEDKGAYTLMIGYGFLLFIIVTIFINYNIQITPLILEKQIGNATSGSNMIAFIGLGAFIAGVSFRKIYQLLKNYLLPSSFLLMGISLYVTTLSQSIVLTSLCSMVIGFSFRCMMPYLIHIFTQQTASMAKFGTTVVLVSYNIGATLSPYEGAVFSHLLHGNTVQSIILANSIFILVISIIGFGVALKMRKRDVVQSV
jgi:predicted MFS family arabinose efflux permease